jgi:hypothetical protein
MRRILAAFLVFSALPLGAKEIADWYAGLVDSPGATLQQYSQSKLLPIDFLRKMGLNDKKIFTINAPGIHPRGDEAVINTTVNKTGEKLTLPSVVLTNFFLPSAGSEPTLWNPNFKNYDDIPTLLNKKWIEGAGFVARITMSHNKPDKILRFYNKLSKLDIPSITGKNVCQSNASLGRKGDSQTSFPYGLWRLAQARKENRLFVVEGESSALTLWYHGYPAIAFGGATKWHDNYIRYFKNIDNIYFLVEPDSGGKNTLSCLRKISKETDVYYREFAKKVKLVVLGEHNDVSDMHINMFGNVDELKNTSRRQFFKNELERFISQGVSLADPGYGFVQGAQTHFTNFDPTMRKIRRFTEDVGESILTGKARSRDEVYQKFNITPSATLQDFSRKKMIPIRELHAAGFSDGIFPHQLFGPIFGISMPTYVLPKGSTDPDSKTLVYYRFRTSMDSAQPSGYRFPNFLFNPNGSLRAEQKKIIYGLEYLASFKAVGELFLVEGESDTITMRHYGFPALGIPGALEWDNSWGDLLKGFSTIYATVEADTGGNSLMELLTLSPLHDQLVFIDFAQSGKDPSDLHGDLVKNEAVNLDAFYYDDEFEQRRNVVASEFRKSLAEVIGRGIPWVNLKEIFENYVEKRRDFDREQLIIYNAMFTANESACQKKEEDCLTHQEIDKRYMPWPYLDFYQTVTGQPIKIYYGRNNAIRVPPIELHLR